MVDSLFRASGRARGPCHPITLTLIMHQGLRDSSYNFGYGFLVSIARDLPKLKVWL